MQADGNQLPFKDQSFDLIVASWSVSRYAPLNFLELENTYINEVGRLLKPDGLATIWPEASRTLGAFGLKRVINENRFSSYSAKKATEYQKLVDAGFRLSFREEPSRTRIYGPENTDYC